MKKLLISLFTCTAMMLCFESCSSPFLQDIFNDNVSDKPGTTDFDEPLVYTIASTMGAMQYPAWASNDGYRSFYIVKAENDDEWFCVESIRKFDYELGYEYVVEGTLLTSEEQTDIEDAVTILTVHNIVSKEQKDSDLPAEEWQWSIDRYNEYFGSKE